MHQLLKMLLATAHLKFDPNLPTAYAYIHELLARVTTFHPACMFVQANPASPITPLIKSFLLSFNARFSLMNIKMI